MRAAGFETLQQDGTWRFMPHGAWTLEDGLAKIDGALRDFCQKSLGAPMEVDLSGLVAMDTVGAMMIQRVVHACGKRADAKTSLTHFSGLKPQYQTLLDQAASNMAHCEIQKHEGDSFVLMLERMGRGTVGAGHNALAILSFIGAIVSRMGGTVLKPWRFRLTPMVHHMEEAGLNATPIVGLMSFLIGAVVAFMGARVLAEFGAEVFTVELVGISVLREFGVLLTAILIAGRSGSAFTAQIGSMKLREEIDAMRVMGIDPLDALVIPRVLALIWTMPVLAFLAAFLGILGGAVVAWGALNIPLTLYWGRMQEVVTLSHLFVGLVKAPFFAFAIATVGCFHGMQVENSAEDLGRRTTMAVVQSLFLVILIDALFAMFFLELDI